MSCRVVFFVNGCVALLLQDEAEAIRNFRAVALDILSAVDKSGDPCLNGYRDLLRLKLDGLLQNPCQESFEAVMGCAGGERARHIVRCVECTVWRRCEIAAASAHAMAARRRLPVASLRRQPARGYHRGLGRCTAVSSRLCPHAHSLSLCSIMPSLRLPSGLPSGWNAFCRSSRSWDEPAPF